MNVDVKQKNNLFAWFLWGLAAIFYIYEFFLRVSPSVMVTELMQTFRVSAVSLGTLSAFYYYAYAAMQLPVGIIVDRFGVKTPLIAACALVSIANIVFAITHTFWVGEFTRLLMGAGSAFAFVGCLKIGTLWFTEDKFALVVGLTNMLGVLGAIVGEAPLAYAVDTMGWQHTLFIAALSGVVILLAMMIFIRDAKSQRVPGSFAHQWQTLFSGLNTVIRNKCTWSNAIYAGLMVAPIAAFGELWGISFLQQDYHASKEAMAFWSTFVFIGIAVGGPLHGWLSGYFKRRKIFLILGALGAFISLSLIVYVHFTEFFYLGVVLFGLGFFSSAMLLIFALNTEINPKPFGGIVVAFTNMLVMIGGTLFQPLIGYLLDLHWKGQVLDGVHLYSIQNYQSAFMMLMASQAAAMVIALFVRETHCCHD